MTSLHRLRSLLHTHPWRQRLSLLLVVLVFLAGLGLRLIDLTDQPLEFHPDRQTGTTFLIATHNPALQAYATHLFEMKDGLLEQKPI